MAGTVHKIGRTVYLDHDVDESLNLLAERIRCRSMAGLLREVVTLGIAEKTRRLDSETAKPAADEQI